MVYAGSQDQRIRAIDKTVGGTSEYLTVRLDNIGDEEAGVFAGISFQKPIGDRFELGIKARGYFISSIRVDAITLTPTLSYRF
jgi:long-subunit fatty acid transport protein